MTGCTLDQCPIAPCMNYPELRAMSDRAMKVALIHHIGGGNLGEDASIAAIREYVRGRWPHCEIACLRMLRDDFAGELSWPLSHRTLDNRVAASTKGQLIKQKLKSLV